MYKKEVFDLRLASYILIGVTLCLAGSKQKAQGGMDFTFHCGSMLHRLFKIIPPQRQMSYIKE